MKTLVLGAKGFIGKAVHERIGGSGWGRAVDLEKDFELPKVETLYVCAGKTGGVGRMRDDPLSFVLPNVKIHIRVFEEAVKAGVDRVVCVQSTTGYPDSPIPMDEEQYCDGELHPAYFNPGNAHRFIYRLAKMFPLEVLFFRPSNVYGPGNDFSPNYSHVIEATVRKVAERHDPIVIWGDGKQVRDAIYIDDLVDAMLMDLPKGSYNVASGDEMSVRQIVDTLCEFEGYEPSIAFDDTKPVALPVRRLKTDKLRSFGWKPKTMMREGLRKTLEWYQSSTV